MDQRGFSRKFSQAHKNNLEERLVRRKKIAAMSQVQRGETAGARAMPKKLSSKPVEQIGAASPPRLKDDDAEATTRIFSHITEKDLPENRIRNLRRLSQADIPSCSVEYKTVLEDLKDADSKDNHLSKKLSKHEEKNRASNDRKLRKTSCMADFIRGRSSKKTTVLTFQSPKMGSRTFTLPVVPEVVTDAHSFSRKTAWAAKGTSPLQCCSHQRKGLERPKRHISLPCPPRRETSFEQENRKLEVTKSSNQYPLVTKNEIRSVQSEKTGTFSTARSGSMLSKGEYLAESVCPEIRYEQKSYSRSRHNAGFSFLSIKPNFKSVGKAALAARIFIENYYRQQQCRRTEEQTDGKSIDKLFEEMKTCRYLRFRDEGSTDYKKG